MSSKGRNSRRFSIQHKLPRLPEPLTVGRAIVGILYCREVQDGGRGAELERVMGIEPTSSAWEAEVLPLNHTRAWGVSIGRTYQG